MTTARARSQRPNTARAIAGAVLTLLALAGSNVFGAANEALTDEQVKQRVIQESINSYSGNCPCPYNSASNGSRCGGRSAHSRAGGARPICYEEEVTDEMIKKWRQRQKR